MKKILTLICLLTSLFTFAENYRPPGSHLIADEQISVKPLVLSRQAIDTVLWAAQDQATLYQVPDPNLGTAAGYLAGTDQLISALVDGGTGNVTIANAQIFTNSTKIRVVGAKFTFGNKRYGSDDTTSVILFNLYKLDGTFLNYHVQIRPAPGTLISQVAVPVRDLKVLQSGQETLFSGAQNIYFPTPLVVDADSGYALGYDISLVNPLDTFGLFTSAIGQPPIPERSVLMNIIDNNWHSFLDTLGWGVSVDLAIFPIVDFTLYDTVSASICKNSSIDFNGTVITQPGTYSYTLVNGSSIQYDSIATVIVTPGSPDTASAQVTSDTLIADQTANQYQWINCSTGLPESGATGQVFIAAQSGGYKVVVYNNPCVDTSVCYDVVAGITELHDIHFSLQPNPAIDLCTLYPGDTKGGTWSADIYNLQGQLVRNLFTNEQTLQAYSFNTQSLAAGLYLVKVTGGNGATGLKKLVIE